MASLKNMMDRVWQIKKPIVHGSRQIGHKAGRIFMNRWLLVTLFAILVVPGLAFAQALETNSCVNCHQETTGNQLVDRNYFQWKDSWHAKKLVTCDKCHGGHYREALPAKAHAGMLESEGKKTASYYLKMDTKCGQCHKDEFEDFSTSTHFKFLQQGKGPSCITCHHPKTGHTLSVKEIVTSCVDCHNEKLKGFEHIPQIARMLLDSMNQTDFIVAWAREFIFLKGKEGKEKAWARSKLVAAEIELSKSKKQWHLFNLNYTEGHIKKAIEYAREAKKLVDQ